MTFTPSKYQAAIFDWAANGSGSAIVEAVAGSGKSTTLVQMITRIPQGETVRVLAFNKRAADDMTAKVREAGHFPNVEVSTFHKLGLSAVNRRLGKGIKANIDGRKMRTLLRELLEQAEKNLRQTSVKGREPDFEDENLSETGSYYDLYGDFCHKLVGLAKGEGFGALRSADRHDWEDLILHHDLSLDSELAEEETAIKFAQQALELSNERALEGHIDFDDMLYLPLLWKLKLWQYDWVLVDEAQDTNPVRRAVAKLALRVGGRLVAVGDRRQSIYGFTGASHDAMDLIKTEFSCEEFPLSVTYRCAKSIVEKAKEPLRACGSALQISAHENAPEGLVKECSLKEALTRLQPTDAIMCRNTAPLIELAFKLVAQGRGCKVLGREIGAGLVSLVKKQNAKGLPNLLDRLNAYREREVAKFTAQGEEMKAEAISDRVECIRIVAEHLKETERTVPKLCQKIESLFSDDEDNGRKVLTLATLHKLKGAEFDRVFLYRPDLCPSKWARQEWQLVQEYNLLYVGYTRARLELLIEGGV